jgi:hypothetical protein
MTPEPRPTDAWCAPAASLPLPTKPAYGRILGRTFTIDKAFLTYEPVAIGQGQQRRSLVLVLQQGAEAIGTERNQQGAERTLHGEPRIAFKINLWRGDLAGLAGKNIVIKPGSPIDLVANYPMVTVETNTVAKQFSATYAEDLKWPQTKKTYMVAGNKYDYGMHLTFGQMQGGRLPGYIVLRVADPQQSFVEGYFYAPVEDDWTNWLHAKPLEDLKAKGEFPTGK